MIKKGEPGWAMQELRRVAKEVESWPAYMRCYTSASKGYYENPYCRRCGTKLAYKNGVCARCE